MKGSADNPKVLETQRPTDQDLTVELLRKAMGALACFMTVLVRACSYPQGRKGAGRVEAGGCLLETGCEGGGDAKRRDWCHSGEAAFPDGSGMTSRFGEVGTCGLGKG